MVLFDFINALQTLDAKSEISNCILTTVAYVAFLTSSNVPKGRDRYDTE